MRLHPRMGLVMAQRTSVHLAVARPAVAHGAQADEVGLLVFLDLLSRDDVMDIQRASLAAHSAAVSGLEHDRAAHRRRDGRSFRHGAVLSLSGIQYGPL